jgi:hypothetical protein
MSGWPVHPDAKPALERLRKTHRLFPVPAYKSTGLGHKMELISPKVYRAELVGAVVEIRFTLGHWYIAEKKERGSEKGRAANNTFVIDLVDVKVLVPPAPPSVSPRKRKVSSFHCTSPLKRLKFDFGPGHA